ncbi:MAG: Terminase-like family protein [Bacteroidetes bacterium ADurb.Bin408]|nr:MAG: Terminase-like family protein [Bacteroidetes bacterium ADurb.Bin408]
MENELVQREFTTEGLPTLEEIQNTKNIFKERISALDRNKPKNRVVWENLIEMEKEVKRRMCYADPLFLAREILGYKDLKEYEPYVEMRKMLTRPAGSDCDKPFNLILVPRSTLKTTYCTITMCVWEIIKNPDIRILITSAVLKNAKDMLSDIKKQISENPKFVALFGNLKGDVWKQDEITVIGRTQIRKEHTIEIGSPDNTKTSKHYDLIKADDLVTAANVTSAESKEKLYGYFMGLLSLLEHPGGRIDVIGTRWDWGDLYSTLLETENGHLEDFNVYIRPAVNDDGTLNFPWKLDEKEIAKLKRQMTTLEFSAQYQLNPVSPETQKFNEDYFKDIYKQEDLPKKYNRYFLVDPAATKNKKSDFSTGIVIDVDENNTWYLRWGFRDRLLPGELEKRIFKTMEKWTPDMTGIETVGFQMYIRKALLKMMLEKSKMFSTCELAPGNRNKDDRISSLQPRFEMKAIKFPARELREKYINTDGREVDFWNNLKEELLKFPNSTKRDCSDILAYGLDVCRPPAKDRVKRDEFMAISDPLARMEARHVANMRRQKAGVGRFGRPAAELEYGGGYDL